MEKCSIACSPMWMPCSEWVPSEWESDKNITVINTSPSVNVLRSEKLCLCEKQTCFSVILTAPIHYRASTLVSKRCYISPNLMKKQTHLHGLYVSHFNFCMNCSFKEYICNVVHSHHVHVTSTGVNSSTARVYQTDSMNTTPTGERRTASSGKKTITPAKSGRITTAHTPRWV